MRQRISRLLASPAARWAIIALHLALLVFLYLQHGIHDDKEALKYIGAAQDLLHGDTTGLLGRYKAYAGYILFLVPFVAIGMHQLAVLAQIVLGIAAAFAVKRMVTRSGASPAMGHLAMAAYLLAPPVQQWTLSLYSEGLFIPMVVLFLEYALRPDARAWRPGLLALALLITRPTGILFVAPALLIPHNGLATWLPAPVRWCAVAALVPLMLFAPALNREQLAVVAGSHVVCGLPEQPDDAALFNGRTLAAAQAFVIERHGPVYWGGLALRRAASLLDPRRSYFSPLHNLAATGILLLYPLALMSIWRQRRSRTVHTLTACLLLNVLLVAITYDEWGGRFLAPLLPIVVVLAAIGTRTARPAEARA